MQRQHTRTLFFGYMPRINNTYSRNVPITVHVYEITGRHPTYVVTHLRCPLTDVPIHPYRVFTRRQHPVTIRMYHDVGVRLVIETIGTTHHAPCGLPVSTYCNTVCNMERNVLVSCYVIMCRDGCVAGTLCSMLWCVILNCGTLIPLS